MYESPRPDDLGDQRTRQDTQQDDADLEADPRSEPGLAGAVARFPLWLIVSGVLLLALIAIYFAWLVLSPY